VSELLWIAQITRQGINYTADSFITVVERSLLLRLVSDSDVIVGQ